jgi:hypothetical protein
MGTRVNKAGKTVPRRLNMGLGPVRRFLWQKRVTKRVRCVSKSVMALIPLKKNTLVKRFRKLRPVNKNLP